MSNNLNLTQLSPSQNNKETTINTQSGELDAALTEFLESDYTSADITLTDAQYRRNMLFRTLNLTVARALNVPALKKLSFIDNTSGTNTLTVTRGAGTVAVVAGAKAVVYTDGTTDGIVGLL